MVCHQNTLGESILGFLGFFSSKDRMSCVAFGRDVQGGRSRFTPGEKNLFFGEKLVRITWMRARVAKEEEYVVARDKRLPGSEFQF